MESAIAQSEQHAGSELQAWFGGTFDPVHNGHLIAAQELVSQLKLSYLNLIPCALSPLKQSTACSNEDRVAMLRLAIEGQPQFRVDTRELQRPGASYTIDSLQAIRSDIGDGCPLVWALGWDAFLSLHHWRDWRELFSLCNMVVLNRPGFDQQPGPELLDFCKGRETVIEELPLFHFGKLVFLNSPKIEIASCEIREKISRGESIRYLLPEKVEGFIQQQNLYRDDKRVAQF